MLKYILIAVAIGVASASCPNACSGHGDCVNEDRCECWANWQGADCSARTCPFAIAWVDTPHSTDEAHTYAECANKGLCDRKSGLCKCFDGYEGSGCARSTCPGGCNGHGTCEYLHELASDPSIRVNGHYGASSRGNAQGSLHSDGTGSQRCSEDQAWLDSSGGFHAGSYSTTTTADVSTAIDITIDGIDGFADLRAKSFCSHVMDGTSQPFDRTYSSWDAWKTMGCKCDGGYYGPDCTSRYCPKGDDPLTVGHEQGYQPTTAEADLAVDGSSGTGVACSTWNDGGTDGTNTGIEHTSELCAAHFKFFDHDTSDDNEIQQVHITIPAASTTFKVSSTHGFSLVYTDLYGGVWETRNIGFTLDASAVTTTSTALRTSIEAALEGLPNEVIPSVLVEIKELTTSSVQFQVQFTDPHNSGDQHMLGCNINECSSGCSPFVKGVVGTDFKTAVCVVQELWKGEDEAAECSNRGACDSSSGVCECYAGHTDEDCSEMTALV